jgi:hypothetical protein
MSLTEWSSAASIAWLYLTETGGSFGSDGSVSCDAAGKLGADTSSVDYCRSNYNVRFLAARKKASR